MSYPDRWEAMKWSTAADYPTRTKGMQWLAVLDQLDAWEDGVGRALLGDEWPGDFGSGVSDLVPLITPLVEMANLQDEVNRLRAAIYNENQPGGFGPGHGYTCFWCGAVAPDHSRLTADYHDVDCLWSQVATKWEAEA